MSKILKGNELDSVTGGGRSGGGSKEEAQHEMWRTEAIQAGYHNYWGEPCPGCKAKSDKWYSTYFIVENTTGPFNVKCFACNYSFTAP